ncbi:MAG: exonuclease domain-containing protein [Flavobacteriales bacterium]
MKNFSQRLARKAVASSIFEKLPAPFFMYAIVDIETTGSSGEQDGITEIAVLLHNGRQKVDEYSSLLNPGCPIPPNISFLTGIDDEMVKEAPSFGDIAEELFQWVEGKVFVAHNVHFDLSFLRKAFAEHGFDLRPRKLCTVRASRKILPGLPSYGLEPLCKQLHINNKGRHRAWGDARATAQLLEQLLKKDHRGTIPALIDHPGKEASLPPNLPKEHFENLPQRPGVYFFHDRSGKVIYVGKARKIRERVLQHFHGDQLSKIRLKQAVRDISHRETGNELIAELMEAGSIRNHMPPFNKAQKFTHRNYGIVHYIDRSDHPRFGIVPQGSVQDPLIGFGRIVEARNFLWQKVERWGLCPKLCNLQSLSGPCTHYGEGKCLGVCNGTDAPEAYSERFHQALRDIQEEEAQSFMIVGEGRDTNERGIVFVENGTYLGYTYLDEKSSFEDIERIKAFMTRQDDNSDTRRIIRKYLQRPKGMEVKDLSE